MRKKMKTYFNLFILTFYISAFTFGGGYVIVPLLKKKCVEELKLLEEKEMLDLVAIAQACPGAIAINFAITIGYRVAGVVGSLFTILGSILPPFIILSIISIFYQFLKQNDIVVYILKGMSAAICAIIASVVVDMSSVYFKERKFVSILIMVITFVLAFFFNMNVVILILIFGLIGGASIYINKIHKKDKDDKIK